MDDPHVFGCRKGLDLQHGAPLSPRGVRKILMSCYGLFRWRRDVQVQEMRWGQTKAKGRPCG